MKKSTSSSVDSCCYTIGDYQICPHEKEIKVYTMIGGVDWDGFTYIPLENIDFNRTEMYLIGNAILFKEQTRGKDLKKAHFIQPQKYQLNHPGIPVIAFDNDSVYMYHHFGILPMIDISDKKILRDDIFEDNDGKLYVLYDNNTSLSPEIPGSLGIDKATIRHLADDFYYDKDRVYYLGYYVINENNRPVSHFAKVIAENKTNRFDVGTSYFTVGDQVYMRSEHGPKVLDLDASSVKEYLLDTYYMTYLISDGDKVYIHSLHQQGADFMEITGLRGLQLQAVFPRSTMWNYNTKTKMVYLKDTEEQSSRDIKNRLGVLMYSQTNGKVFIIDRDGEYISLNGILIPDSDGLSVRPFDRQSDEDVMKQLIPFTLYKFNDVFYDALLAAYKENGIDSDKITPVGEGMFHTDGKHLILMDEIQLLNRNFGEEGVAHINYYFDNWVCLINNPENLKIINNNILTDGTTLYYKDRIGRDNKLMAVSFTNLGIPFFYLEKGKDRISLFIKR